MDRRLVLSKQNRDLFRMALGRFFAPKWAAGFSRGFNPELYTEYRGRLEAAASPATTSDCLEGIARCEQNTGWKPMLQYAVASSLWVRGDIGRMPLRHRSTVREQSSIGFQRLCRAESLYVGAVTSDLGTRSRAIRRGMCINANE